MRVMTLLITAGLTVLASAPAITAQETNDPLWDMCKIAEPRDLSWEYRWRWRAEQNLGCLIYKLDQSVSSTPEMSVATISKQELRQLLSLAWGARDAAQRIGR
jgi:hypothetical protein